MDASGTRRLWPIFTPRKRRVRPSLELVLELVLLNPAARAALTWEESGAVRLASRRTRLLYDENVRGLSLYPDEGQPEVAMPRPLNAGNTKYYSDFMERHGRIRPIRAQIFPQNFSCPNLRTLDVSVDGIHVEQVRQLAVAARQWPHLRTLIITDMGFPLSGMADLLSSTPQLLKLELQYFHASPDLCSILQAAALPSLTDLIIHEEEFGDPGWISALENLADLTSLTSLSLRGQGFDPVGLVDLSLGECAQRLVDLDVSNNLFTAIAFRSLAQGRWPCLRRLNLSENILGTAALAALAEGPWVPHLEELRISSHLYLGDWGEDSDEDAEFPENAMTYLARGRFSKLERLCAVTYMLDLPALVALMEAPWPKLKELSIWVPFDWREEVPHRIPVRTLFDALLRGLWPRLTRLIVYSFVVSAKWKCGTSARAWVDVLACLADVRACRPSLHIEMVSYKRTL